jgi:cathepsin D
LRIKSPQQLPVVLDTGSSDLWFASSSCQNCTSGVPELNMTGSSTLQRSSQSVIFIYGSGQASGTLAKDTISIGSYTMGDQVFAVVNNVTGSLLDRGRTGIMGLAFESLAVSRSTPFWQSLVNGNQLSSPEMSFFITRFPNAVSSSQVVSGGTFTLGGTNTSFYNGDIEFQDLVTPGQIQSYWLINVSCTLPSSSSSSSYLSNV